MITVEVTQQSNIPRSLDQARRSIAGLGRLALAVWLEHTPVRTGRARRNTRLSGQQIQANYVYAGALDQGSSDQQPKGMSQPTVQAIQAEYRRILKGI